MGEGERIEGIRVFKSIPRRFSKKQHGKGLREVRGFHPRGAERLEEGVERQDGPRGQEKVGAVDPGRV